VFYSLIKRNLDLDRAIVDEEQPPFELHYKWRGVQEEDLSLAIKVMFFLTLLFAVLISCVLVCNQDAAGQSSTKKSSSAVKNRPSSEMYASAGISVKRRS
jgi:hypothetical protein